VTTTFTAATPGPCTVTVTLTTASGRKASASQTTTIITGPVPVPSLPSCTDPEHFDSNGVPLNGVDNHSITGAAGDRAFVYVQLYDEAAPFDDDTILHLRSTPLAAPSSCPAAGDLECDDDDGDTYTSLLLDTPIAYVLNSVIAGHPLGSSSDVVAVHGWGGGPVDPYRLYRHVVPAANLVVYPIDPGDSVDTAVDVPTTPTPWMIGQEITAGDVDWYRFKVDTIPAEGLALFVALDLSPDSPSAPHDDVGGWDGVIELYDSIGTQLKSVDGSTFGSPEPPAEAMAIRINDPGIYFIAVRHFSATGTGPGYHLTACTTTPTVLPQGAEEPLVEKPFTPKYPDDK